MVILALLATKHISEPQPQCPSNLFSVSFEKVIFIFMTRKEKKIHQHTYLDSVILVSSFKMTRKTI